MRRVGVGIALATALLAAAAVSPAHAASGPQVADPARAAALQTVLDRVLGPGAAVVDVTDELSAGPVSRVQQRWEAARPVQVAAARVRTSAGSASSVSRVDAVDVTTTATATGQVVLGRRIAVVVDRSRLHGTPLARVRRTVAALVGGRDRISVVAVARFAAPAAPRSAPPADPTPLAVLGGLAAVLLVLVGWPLMRRRRSSRILRARPAP